MFKPASPGIRTRGDRRCRSRSIVKNFRIRSLFIELRSECWKRWKTFRRTGKGTVTASSFRRPELDHRFDRSESSHLITEARLAATPCMLGGRRSEPRVNVWQLVLTNQLTMPTALNSTSERNPCFQCSVRTWPATPVERGARLIGPRQPGPVVGADASRTAACDRAVRSRNPLY